MTTNRNTTTKEHEAEISAYVGSMQRWDRADLRDFLDRQYVNLMDSISGLDEDILLTAPVCSHWCSRDVLAHVLSWKAYGQVIVEQWPNPEPTAVQKWLGSGNENVDQINERLLTERAHMGLIEIADGLITVHRRILRAFDNFSAAELAGQGEYGWGETGELANFFYFLAYHEAEHAADIWHYRTQ